MRRDKETQSEYRTVQCLLQKAGGSSSAKIYAKFPCFYENKFCVISKEVLQCGQEIRVQTKSDSHENHFFAMHCNLLLLF